MESQVWSCTPEGSGGFSRVVSLQQRAQSHSRASDGYFQLGAFTNKASAKHTISMKHHLGGSNLSDDSGPL